MNGIKKLSAALGVTALIVLASATQASADQTRTGARTCAGGAQLVGLQSYTSASSGYHYFSSGGRSEGLSYYYPGSWVTGSSFTSANWEAYTVGTFSSASAFCF